MTRVMLMRSSRLRAEPVTDGSNTPVSTELLDVTRRLLARIDELLNQTKRAPVSSQVAVSVVG